MSRVDYDNVLYFDIETLSANKLWEVEPEDFFRLGQYAWSRSGEVHITTSREELKELIRSADRIVGHNILAFDLMALFREDYLEVVDMAYDKKIVDTFVFAHLVNPAPDKFTDYKGHTHYDGQKPVKSRVWLSLENQAYQLGVEGKFGDLRELAKRYNPEGTKVADLDFGLIPLEDADFIAYAKQDITALQAVAGALLQLGPADDYVWREMLSVAIDNQMSANGFRVDIPAAEDRVEFLAERKATLMEMLQKDYGLPSGGKQPWRTNAGKEAIFNVLASYAITPKTVKDWDKTATGNYSLGGEVLKRVTAGTEAEELGEALAELMGQRSLAELALANVKPDGKVHPDITSLQRSGRKSFTNPALSIWGAHGGRSIDKRYFIADEDSYLLEADYSQIDARCVAALSGDLDFNERFTEGVDAHELSGRLAFGDEVYEGAMGEGWETDESVRKANPLRHIGKIGTHSWNYNIGAKTLASQLGIEESVAREFIDSLNNAYPDVAKWKNDCVREGESGRLRNWWGRTMLVDKDRAWTQAPGLVGQSSATEILKDSLIRLYEHDREYLRWVRATIHDAIVFCVPNDLKPEDASAIIREIFEWKWNPTGRLEIMFGLSVGKPAQDWEAAGH